MRSLAIVLPASLIFAASIQAQALTEHAAAAAGAAIGTAGGKGLSNSLGKIFSETDKQTEKAAKPDSKKQSKPVADTDPSTQKSPAKRASNSAGAGPAPFDAAPTSGASHAQRRAPRPAAPEPESAVAVRTSTPNRIVAEPPVPEPVVKIPTVEDLAGIKVGAPEGDMIAALGLPASRVTIPDDDGHLRETCQYWANGKLLGTIRLDNGQVSSVEPFHEN